MDKSPMKLGIGNMKKKINTATFLWDNQFKLSMICLTSSRISICVTLMSLSVLHVANTLDNFPLECMEAVTILNCSWHE